MRLTVLHRDDYLVAVDKPPGLLVHRTRIADAETFALQALRDQLGRRVHAVHRLDRPTSGVLLFALPSSAIPAMGRGGTIGSSASVSGCNGCCCTPGGSTSCTR